MEVLQLKIEPLRDATLYYVSELQKWCVLRILLVLVYVFVSFTCSQPIGDKEYTFIGLSSLFIVGYSGL